MVQLLHNLAQINTSALPHANADNSTISTILNIVFGMVGSIAFLMIVIGGFRYIIAHGDPNAVAQARKTIIYAVVGLLVTLVAYAIVIFVVKEVA